MLKGLEYLKGSSAQVFAGNACPETGMAPVRIVFSQGTQLRALYWRITKNGRAFISSFDHKQKYGLPAPIDAIDTLKNELLGPSVTEARHDKETGDLLFFFSNNINLQVLNVTGYEIWEIFFPDGTGAYSNSAK